MDYFTGYPLQRSFSTRQDIRKYIEDEDEVKLLETLQKILKDGWYECLRPSLADAINFFCERKNIEQVKHLVALFKEHCKYDNLDKYKVVKYTRLLIENGEFDEALVFLEGQESLGHSEKNGIDRLVGTLMKVAQRTRDEDKISKLGALLETKNYM